MTNVQLYMMKLAEESRWDKTKKFFGNLGESGIKRRELRKIKSELRESKPQTEREKAVDRLAGRQYTAGQYARRAGVGALVGSGAQVAGSLIEGGKARRAGIRPRALGRAAAVGALFGSAIPAASRLADIEAAKRGAF